MKDTILLTGGSKGIGLDIVKKLQDDYKIINLSRTPSLVKTYQIDLSNIDSIEPVYDQLVEKEGPPDILINCAGSVVPGGLQELAKLGPMGILDMININFVSALILTQLFVKYNKTGGKIINIASTSGQRPSPGWSVYGAAKAALINFSLSMSEELKPYNISVYCIAPGRCATDLRRVLAPDEDQSKIMQPEEVAEFVKYLLDDNVLSGQVINLKRSNL